MVYGLLTKCEVTEMAGYWLSSFILRVYGPSWPKKNLINKGFIIWLSGKFFLRDTAGYPASRVSFDLPRQIGKRKETLRAASRFFDPPLIRENGWVSPVSCRWNRFLLTRIIIRLFLSGFSTAIRMHKCRDHANCTRAINLELFTLQNY